MHAETVAARDDKLLALHKSRPTWPCIGELTPNNPPRAASTPAPSFLPAHLKQQDVCGARNLEHPGRSAVFRKTGIGSRLHLAGSLPAPTRSTSCRSFCTNTFAAAVLRRTDSCCFRSARNLFASTVDEESSATAPPRRSVKYSSSTQPKQTWTVEKPRSSQNHCSQSRQQPVTAVLRPKPAHTMQSEKRCDHCHRRLFLGKLQKPYTYTPRTIRRAAELV